MLLLSCSVVSNSLLLYGLCPWNFPGKNTGVGCHFHFQGIFPTLGLNPIIDTPIHICPPDFVLVM